MTDLYPSICGECGFPTTHHHYDCKSRVPLTILRDDELKGDESTPHPVPGKLLVRSRDTSEWTTEAGVLVTADDEEGDYRRVEVIDPGTTDYCEGDEVLVRPTAGGIYKWIGKDAKTRQLRVISENEIFVFFRK